MMPKNTRFFIGRAGIALSFGERLLSMWEVACSLLLRWGT